MPNIGMHHYIISNILFNGLFDVNQYCITFSYNLSSYTWLISIIKKNYPQLYGFGLVWFISIISNGPSLLCLYPTH